MPILCVVSAVAANLVLLAVGRAAGAALVIDPGLGAPDHAIGAFDVAWKTAVPLALGAVLVTAVARHSRRWATAGTVAGLLVAVVSIPFVVAGAHDTLTGVVLASMHSLAALAYVVVGTWARSGTGHDR